MLRALALWGTLALLTWPLAVLAARSCTRRHVYVKAQHKLHQFNDLWCLVGGRAGGWLGCLEACSSPACLRLPTPGLPADSCPPQVPPTRDHLARTHPTPPRPPIHPPVNTTQTPGVMLHPLPTVGHIRGWPSLTPPPIHHPRQDTDTWEWQRLSGEAPEAPQPCPRDRASMAAVGGGAQLLVVGGADSMNRRLDDAWLFDLEK